MSALPFDATVTLFAHHLKDSPLQGLPHGAVAEAVGTVVRAVPGAGWVDVEHAGGALPEPLRHRSPLDRLYAAGSSVVPQGPEWDVMRERIETAIAGAQACWELDERPVAVVHPAPAGLRRWFRSQREA